MRSSRRSFRPALQDVQEDSDDEAFYGSNMPVGYIMFTSNEIYAAVQRISAMRPPCDCTEDVPIEPCLTPNSSEVPLRPENQSPHPRSSTPVRSSDDTPSDADISMSEVSSIPEDINGNATPPQESLSDVELSPILVCKHKRRNKNITRRKLLTTPEPPLVRRRLSVVQKMPKPSTAGRLIANRIIKYARCIRNIHDKEMCCVSCGLLPTSPVTGQCGHTRCLKCIKVEKKCPCGSKFPEPKNFNILIRDLVGNLICEGQSSGSNVPTSSNANPDGSEDTVIAATASKLSAMCDHRDLSKEPNDGNAQDIEMVPSITDSSPAFNFGGHDVSANEAQNHSAGSASTSRSRLALKRRARNSTFKGPIPMSSRARYNHAVELLRVGKHFDAAPHLALVAASGQKDCRQAHKLLIPVLTFLSRKRDPKMLAVELNIVIRRLSSTSWLKQADMECILCCDYFANPVTTPCGHMFCRSCLERTLDHKRRCPLCLQSLEKFNLSHISNTTFVEGALKSINAIPSSPFPESELIPIIVCTVGYPSISCPLVIYDARYCRMVHRVLQTGTRKFGIVATDTSKDYVDYGTVLEVRDCIQLANGSSLLSTVGLSRFKVIERCIRDGYEVARVLPFVDEIPAETMEMWDIKVLGRQIITKALVWLSRLPGSKIKAMEDAFGSLPLDDNEDEWWNSTDGPAWLWWLVAVLPLRTQIKLLILSTDSLLKRMRAVCCTLVALDLYATA